MTPAKAAFGSVGVILIMIGVNLLIRVDQPLRVSSLRHEGVIGTFSSSEETPTSSHSGSPSAFLVFFSPPTTPLEKISAPRRYLHTPLAKTSLGRRRRFPIQLRGSHPPTQLPQTT
jgi:hypothetical protein